MIKVDHMVVGLVSTNCYFLINEALREAVIVDPGAQPDQIREYLAREELKPAAILLTHGHFDHMMGAETLRDAYEIPIYASAQEKRGLNSPSMNLMKKYFRKDYILEADVYLADGEVFELAGCKIQLLDTPGHTPGSCCYYLASEGIAFTGDTLFLESVGRTDFEGGSYTEICKSIKEKLFTLPEKVRCYPGHGDQTSIGHEKERNPYVR